MGNYLSKKRTIEERVKIGGQVLIVVAEWEWDDEAGNDDMAVTISIDTSAHKLRLIGLEDGALEDIATMFLTVEKMQNAGPVDA